MTIQDLVTLNDWHVVARSADVAVDSLLSARLLDEDLVLWRSGDRILAWRDLCVHRGAKLSLGCIRAGILTCPYHGWAYDPTGQCIHMPAHPTLNPPARAQIQSYLAQERYGLIWVCLGHPQQDLPPFPEWDDASYRKVFCGPYHYRASAPRAIENFLDVAHFPFVHEGMLGDPAHPEIEDYTVSVTPDGLIAKNVQVWQPDPYGGLQQGARVAYDYVVPRPFTAYFIKVSKEVREHRRVIFMTTTPVSLTESISWWWIAMNYGFDIPAEVFQQFEDEVVAGDVRILESQRPELLPLDLQAELHLPSDRTAIAYRKWLKSLGVTFGTA
ncbi:MAG: aromatic ring-hydroxylating dioxygenase subunit alpha [Phormidesmis sp.]